MGTLYIVGTPIGNLGDFSPRAAQVLRSVDFIAAEDTRVTLKLLNHFEIRATLISYHEHNAAARGPELLGRLLNGENGAIVTDAGMPCISDPGEGLVALCPGKGAHSGKIVTLTAEGRALAERTVVPVIAAEEKAIRAFGLASAEEMHRLTQRHLECLQREFEKIAR